jgi:UDP-glucose 4-epimerase
MAILVTGGAGYIGSVTAHLLRSRGKQVVVLDNLSRGHPLPSLVMALGPP